MFLEPIYVSTLLYGFGIVCLIGLTAFYLNVLTLDGFVAGLIVGVPILVFGGFDNFILLLSFLILGSVLSRIGKDVKRLYNPIGEKVGTRAWPNVVANGFWPMISSVMIYFFKDPSVKLLWEIFFMGSLASMVADTSATEIGMLSRHKPRFIIDPNSYVEPGSSGGVTLLGSLASVLFSILFGFLAYLVSGFNPLTRFTLIGFSPLVYSRGREYIILFVIAVSGALGSFFDSFLGASIQGKYKCVVCGNVVESHIHCGKESMYLSGVRFIDNHMVNFISGFVGGVIAVILFSLI